MIENTSFLNVIDYNYIVITTYDGTFEIRGITTYRNGPKRTFVDTETDFVGTETDFSEYRN